MEVKISRPPTTNGYSPERWHKYLASLKEERPRKKKHKKQLKPNPDFIATGKAWKKHKEMDREFDRVLQRN